MRRLRTLGVGGLAMLLVSAGLAATYHPANAAVTQIDSNTNVAVSSWGADRLDMFARGVDGTLKHRVYNGRWSSWESLGGSITSAPAAASWGPGRIDVFVRWTDGSVRTKFFDEGVWSEWQSLGGSIVGDPAVASWGSGRLDVFARGGAKQETLYHKAFTSSDGKWKPEGSWENLGGAINTSPTVTAWATGRLDIFARGPYNVLWHIYWNGRWSRWEHPGNATVLDSAPAAVHNGSGYLDVFARVGNGISRISYSPGRWSGWTSMGGSVKGAPAATRWPGSHYDVFAWGTDGVLRQRTWHGIFGWTPSWATVTDTALTLPPPSYTRTVAIQAPPPAGSSARVGPLVYAFVNNIGQIVYGYQSDPGNVGSVQWSILSGNEAFAAQPALIDQADRRIQVSAVHSSGDIWAGAHGDTVTLPAKWVLQGGGQMTSVSVAKQSDGSPVLLAVDSNGAGWYLPQPSATGPNYGTWRSLGITGLTGAPTGATVRDGVQVFAMAGGTMRTATLYPSGTTTAWTDVGNPGLGFVGSPAVVVYPGYRLRVVARTSDGTIHTKAQDSLLAWPATWTALEGALAAGDPAAVLSPQSSRIEIMVRGPEGQVYSNGETGQGFGEWRGWKAWLDIGSTATDPTILVFDRGQGPEWAFIVRTADQRNLVFSQPDDTMLAAAGAEPRLRAEELPPAPTR